MKPAPKSIGLVILLLITCPVHGQTPNLIGKYESFEGDEDHSGKFFWILGTGWEFRPNGVLIMHSFWNPQHRKEGIPIHQQWTYNYKVLDSKTLMRTDDQGHEIRLPFELKPNALLIGVGEPHWSVKVKKFRFEH
jgi:hypothetical protein